MLPKQRPYDVPRLHASGAMTERGPRRAKAQDMAKPSEADAEPQLEKQTEETAVLEKPRRKVFVSAPVTSPRTAVTDPATTEEVLTQSLVTPRGGPAKTADAQGFDPALGPHHMHMMSTARASYVLTDAKPSVSPRIPAVSPRASV